MEVIDKRLRLELRSRFDEYSMIKCGIPAASQSRPTAQGNGAAVTGVASCRPRSSVEVSASA
jgi:hypothetical protein